jgi:hypothetical protein
MSTDPADKPPMPFGLSPSARPAPGRGIHAPVRVPPPPRTLARGSSSFEALDDPARSEAPVDRASLRTVLGASAAEGEATPPVASAEPEWLPPPLGPGEVSSPLSPPFSPKRTGRRWVPVVLAATVLIAITAATAVGLRARHAAATKAASPSATSPGPMASTANEPTPPAVSVSADTPAPLAPSASAVASSGAALIRRPFDRAKAQAALEATATEAAQCQLPRGYSCQVRVTYAPDGNVQSVVPLKRCSGTAVGACIASHLKSAAIDPFAGRATAYVYTFVSARASPSK